MCRGNTNFLFFLEKTQNFKWCVCMILVHCIWRVLTPYRTIYCLAGSSVLTSGYSSFTPGSHTNFGQQYGNGADLLVLSASNLQRSLAIGNGPQSSTDSNKLKRICVDHKQDTKVMNCFLLAIVLNRNRVRKMIITQRLVLQCMLIGHRMVSIPMICQLGM